MSYTDIDPDYYAERDRQKIQQIMDDEATYYINRERQNAGLLPLPPPSTDMMQFAPPEYTTPLNADCLKDADYRADLRWPADGRPFSYPPCYETKADPDVNTQVEVPEPTYTVYDTESSHWVDVPFHVAWLFYGLFMFMGQLLVFGFSTLVLHWPLGVYVMWGIVNLLALPFLSYWWTKHARDRHYGAELLQEVRPK